MSENQLTTTTDKVLNCINKNDYNGISFAITNEVASQLIISLAEVSAKVSTEAFNAVAKIYSEAIIAQERLDTEIIKSQTEYIRKFNDIVEETARKIDLKDPQTAETFEMVCKTLRKNLLAYFKLQHRPSFWRRALPFNF